jgi:hypothetical protein
MLHQTYLLKTKTWFCHYKTYDLGLAQVVERLPSTHKALSSNPILTKKKERKKKDFQHSSSLPCSDRKEKNMTFIVRHICS